jgi:hypothetical protein
VLFRNIVDQLHNNNRFAHAGAAEHADFTTLDEGHQEVDNFNTGFQLFRFGGLIHQGRGRAVNGISHITHNRSFAVNGFSQNVDEAPQGGPANRSADGSPGVHCFHAADQTVRGTHGHRADRVVAQVLGNFQGKVKLPSKHVFFVACNF